MNPLDMLKSSKCFSCKYRISRVVEPFTQEDRDYYIDALGIEDEDIDEYELYIEQHKCLLTDEDIDGVIIECNQYEKKRRLALIREYKF